MQGRCETPYAPRNQQGSKIDMALSVAYGRSLPTLCRLLLYFRSLACVEPVRRTSLETIKPSDGPSSCGLDVCTLLLQPSSDGDDRRAGLDWRTTPFQSLHQAIPPTRRRLRLRLSQPQHQRTNAASFPDRGCLFAERDSSHSSITCSRIQPASPSIIRVRAPPSLSS